ncbi:hypothetical protein [Tateyamaria sp. Alg231-49]|uniref:hypothetical protein n=1 Tax=Tateyamaria sp. Alg231-49 TaxID=1922219 RepID=UPI000D54FBC9|nr:hypothetical protein [Tateyamaria sp. Alg231-49]
MMTKTKTLNRTNLSPVFLMGLMLIATVLLTACGNERRADRIAFDGQYFRTDAKKLDKRRLDFEVTVRPVSASLNGALEAGLHEGIRYCIGNFGSSDIRWANGPESENGQVPISNDRLVLQGTCTGL